MSKCEKDNCTCTEELCECDENCNCEERCNCEEEKCRCDENTDKLNEAFNKISELEDALLRNKAEFINYRKRLEDETSRLMKYSNVDIVKELLPIIDNFERAIKLGGDDEIFNGFNMVYGNLLNVLTKFEVKEVECLNLQFDPANAQAVISEESDQESGIVLEVLQKGYILKDKVIRPAMVKVSA